MPPDTYRLPDMLIFPKYTLEPCHAQTTLMQQRLTHLEWIFCQLSDGPNFCAELSTLDILYVMHRQYLEQAVALLGRFRCAC
jgi:hypothetical protein